MAAVSPGVCLHLWADVKEREGKGRRQGAERGKPPGNRKLALIRLHGRDAIDCPRHNAPSHNDGGSNHLHKKRGGKLCFGPLSRPKAVIEPWGFPS